MGRRLVGAGLVRSKGRSKSVVTIQHAKLESRDAVDRLKSYWAEHLGTLAEKLEKRKEE